MRVAHLADLHLGFRAFQRIAKNGTNLRESDVARAFREAVDQLIAIAPDVVIVAGDVFHASRPPNNAIVHAHRQFLRLRTELPDATIVIVSGNHDSPRATDTGNILMLFEALGIHVAAHGAKRITVPERSLSVLAVPDAGGPRPVLEPDPGARYNVLVLHGEVEYVAPGAEHGWSYIGLGHYHVHREVAPRTCYAGALDYTSSNIWGELAEERAAGLAGKGFVVADLDTGVHEFRPVPSTRGFADLPEIDGHEKTPAELDALIRCAVAHCQGGIDGKVVRLAIRDVPRSVSRSLDVRALRSYRARALNFQLVTHKPADAIVVGTDRPARRHKSLKEIVRESLMKREIPADLDMDRMIELSNKYLEEAGAQAEPTADEQPVEASA